MSDNMVTPDVDAAPTGIVREVYLSQLTFDLRRRDVWRLLGDSYRLHQRLLMAFPEASDGGAGRVLFRAESGKGEVNVLAQSTILPDWARLDDDLLAAPPRGPKLWRLWNENGETPSFTAGQTLRYRLRANPTYRFGQDADPDARPGETGRQKGKRYAHLTRRAQGDWLARKGEQHGFRLPLVPSGTDWLDPFGSEPEAAKDETPYDVRIVAQERITGVKPVASATGTAAAHSLTHYGVDFDGVLTVTDAQAFACAVVSGIGSAKGFGFGLLSLARA